MLNLSNNFDDEECEEIWERIKIRRQKKIRERPDFFNLYEDKDFRDRFRLSKEVALMVFNLIKDHLEDVKLNNALPPLKKLLLTFRFYATGGFQQTVGDIFGVSKSTACRSIALVTYHISKLRPKFVTFSNNDEDIAESQNSFFKIAKFPRVIVCMDCTHIKISSPGGDDAELFGNRKGFFSVNVQTICDSNLKILDIVARWPGSVHDSRIFKNSRIHTLLESKHFKNGIVLGDSGYENTNIVLTPLLTPRTASERLYNESHIRKRNCVERSYGVWKRRFPILAMGIRMALDKVPAIIVATAVLHNVCCMHKDTIPPPVSADLELQIRNSMNFQITNFNSNSTTNRLNNKNYTRNTLINTYFSTL